MSNIKIYNEDSYKFLEQLGIQNIFHGVATDPPYGINFKNKKWDKQYPKSDFWKLCHNVLYPGGYLISFSSTKLLHKMTQEIENADFEIIDILMWSYLNGMPKNQNIGLLVDKELNVQSNENGVYKYKQGYSIDSELSYTEEKIKYTPSSKEGIIYDGFGVRLKPAYEPIILAQKRISEETVAANILKYGTGALNLEETRIPYDQNEKSVGHNPHELGRVASNVLRDEYHNDGYDKFFCIQKVRKSNGHPTAKPVGIMEHLVKLISVKNQFILDPFVGSGTTLEACINTERNCVGIEKELEYFNISHKRIFH